MRQFYTYILTNTTKSVLYVGMTNNLQRRLTEHYFNRGSQKAFTGKYYCYYLLYYEIFPRPMMAISREKEVKKWNRKKKEALIDSFNPKWLFLNSDIMDWPPHPDSRPVYD